MKHIKLRNILLLTGVLFTSCISLDDLNILKAPSLTTGVPSSTTANCYIVSSSGTYDLKTVKGGSAESVGAVSYAEVLWESFGTDIKPSVGELISSVKYYDGKITYTVPSPFREGNAVIAAKDALGEILWSWHIWLTDQPQEQVYYNNAGIMMDRNLGATSATPGDVGALGLLYQWGRKDPFLGSASIHKDTDLPAKSTCSWPSPVSSSSSKGTIEYATKNPMTFITRDSDWHYSSRNNDLWKSSKTIYDPCPVGWRVPDGGAKGVWSRACYSAAPYLINDCNFDDVDEGVDFFWIVLNESCWYPASGHRDGKDGAMNTVGYYGLYWSVTTSSVKESCLFFNCYDFVNPDNWSFGRADGMAVRCLKE